MENPFLESVLLKVLRTVAFFYDLLVFIPYYFIQEPGAKLEEANQVKAKSVSSLRSGPYRHVSEPVLSTTYEEDCSTLDELLVKAISVHRSRPCLGTREELWEEEEVQPNGKVFKKKILGDYKWRTYEDVGRRVTHFGAGLHLLQQRPKQNILIFAETRADWIIAAQACFRYNFPVVTLYATLGDEAVIHGINESEVTHVITSANLLPKFAKLLIKMPKVTTVVYMEGTSSVNKDGFTSTSVTVISMADVEALGAQPDKSKLCEASCPPQSDDLAVIMYTSGSTGLPKGVMLTHGNVMAAVSGLASRVTGIGHNDVYIGYLPLAHILELAAEITCMVTGCKVGYSSAATLSDMSTAIKKGHKGDVTTLCPTLMACVPTIMDRIYKNVWEKVNEGSLLKRVLFKFAYAYKESAIERGYDTPIINRLILKPVKSLLGGRIRGMLSGAAPLSADTQRFMNVCFCCPVIQGYGLTETCAAGTVCQMDDLSTGRVGAPLSCCEIKLVDWEEGGYRVTDAKPSGEVWIGGPNVALGYYKNPQKTAEEFHSVDGQRWFATGDIGCIHPDGCLQIIDRKKDLVKLQAGEYVSLGKVEATLNLCPLVDQICVNARSTHSYTVALVVPNPKSLKATATELGLEELDWNSLCEHEKVKKVLLQQLTQTGSTGNLQKFEIPTKVHLCPDPWTPDTGLVTDSLKLKRLNLAKTFADVLIALYP